MRPSDYRAMADAQEVFAMANESAGRSGELRHAAAEWFRRAAKTCGQNRAEALSMADKLIGEAMAEDRNA